MFLKLKGCKEMFEVVQKNFLSFRLSSIRCLINWFLIKEICKDSKVTLRIFEKQVGLFK